MVVDEELDDLQAEHERRRLAAAEKVIEKSASEVFAESVLIQRKRKGLTQQQLATRLAEIGYPVHWTTVSKLEKLERKPKLEDLIAFSVALDVAPVHMLGASYLPHGTALKLTRSVAGLHQMHTRQWLRGERALPEQDQRRYHSEVAAEEFTPPDVALLSYRGMMLMLANELLHAARGQHDPVRIKSIIRRINDVADEVDGL